MRTSSISPLLAFSSWFVLLIQTIKLLIFVWHCTMTWLWILTWGQWTSFWSQAFFSRVVSMTADLISKWQSVGFAHGKIWRKHFDVQGLFMRVFFYSTLIIVISLFLGGVCNTDNFSLLSITIDYGPFGFMDDFNPGKEKNFDEIWHIWDLIPNLFKVTGTIWVQILLTFGWSLAIDFVPNTSDDEGRYSYKNQPNVGFFNLAKLLQALKPLIEDYSE